MADERTPKSVRIARAAQEALRSEAGDILLDHLAEFCHEKSDCFVRDSERMSCYLAGQRSVYLHLIQLLNKEVQ